MSPGYITLLPTGLMVYYSDNATRYMMRRRTHGEQAFILLAGGGGAASHLGFHIKSK